MTIPLITIFHQLSFRGRFPLVRRSSHHGHTALAITEKQIGVLLRLTPSALSASILATIRKRENLRRMAMLLASCKYGRTRRAEPALMPFRSSQTRLMESHLLLDPNVRPAPSRPYGPPFEITEITHHVINSQGHQLIPELEASIQKGFFQVDRKWITYRRNYFAVSCSFNFGNLSSDGQLYLTYQHHMEAINQFAVSITAVSAVNNNNHKSKTSVLVQHSSKRNRATQSSPGRVTVQALQLRTPSAVGNSPANRRHQSPPTSHTFERIQFKKSTTNEGKRRVQQQYFHIVVELSVEIKPSDQSSHWTTIATRGSQPVVVRGRAPRYYRDGRCDSIKTPLLDTGSAYYDPTWKGELDQGGHPVGLL